MPLFLSFPPSVLHPSQFFFLSFSFLLILLHVSSSPFSFILCFLSLSNTFPSLHRCLINFFSLSIFIIFPFISSLLKLFVPFSPRHTLFFTLFSLFLPSFPPSLAFLIIHPSFESLYHCLITFSFLLSSYFVLLLIPSLILLPPLLNAFLPSYLFSLFPFFFISSPFLFLFSPPYIPFLTLFLLSSLSSFPSLHHCLTTFSLLLTWYFFFPLIPFFNRPSLSSSLSYLFFLTHLVPLLHATFSLSLYLFFLSFHLLFCPLLARSSSDFHPCPLFSSQSPSFLIVSFFFTPSFYRVSSEKKKNLNKSSETSRDDNRHMWISNPLSSTSASLSASALPVLTPTWISIPVIPH